VYAHDRHRLEDSAHQRAAFGLRGWSKFVYEGGQRGTI
jgi:hypothetical protein